MTGKHLTRTRAGKALLSLAVLALLALTLQSLVFSDASFTATGWNAANTFTAGSLWHENDKAGVAVVDAAYLRPGVFKEGLVTIAGRGSLAGAYALTKGTVVDSSADGALSRTLVLTVWQQGVAAPIFRGVLSAWQGPIPLGTIDPDTSRTYVLRLEYPAGSADSALDGSSLTLPLTFTGSSS